MGNIIGYARVSTIDQNLDRQLKSLNDYGCKIIYKDKISGKSIIRPQLEAMILECKEGDTIVVSSLSRLGRSTKDLIDLSILFKERNIELVSLKESIDTSSPSGKMMFGLLAVLYEFERDMNNIRVREGLAVAKARGVKLGRPKKKDVGVKKALELYKEGELTTKEIIEQTGISKSMFFRRLKAIQR
ncbi:MAG: DNA-invertase hin [Candidatus Izimaplasma bacterium HR2]|nr:MAG: DNA-invertase hin [Candidatus Izimaplasma bacterium HR2]